MSTIIRDKRIRGTITAEEADRMDRLTSAPPAKGFLFKGGPLHGKGQHYGCDPLGNAKKRQITDFLHARPLPKYGLWPYRYKRGVPVFNDLFKYRYRFDRVNDDGYAVYIMPGSNV